MGRVAQASLAAGGLLTPARPHACQRRCGWPLGGFSPHARPLIGRSGRVHLATDDVDAQGLCRSTGGG